MNPANIPTQERARAYLKRYTASDRVSDLYDGDEEFANALHDLIGPSFEYPDWSHKTVGEILKQLKRK